MEEIIKELKELKDELYQVYKIIEDIENDFIKLEKIMNKKL